MSDLVFSILFIFLYLTVDGAPAKQSCICHVLISVTVCQTAHTVFSQDLGCRERSLILLNESIIMEVSTKMKDPTSLSVTGAQSFSCIYPLERLLVTGLGCNFWLLFDRDPSYQPFTPALYNNIFSWMKAGNLAGHKGRQWGAGTRFPNSVPSQTHSHSS